MPDPETAPELAAALRSVADRLTENAHRMREAIDVSERKAKECRALADEFDPPPPPVRYQPVHHSWPIGTRVRVLRNAEFSWGWEAKVGDVRPIVAEKDLRRLDFPSVHDYFEEVTGG